MSAGAFKQRLAHVGLFYTTAIWGTTFFIVKDVLKDVDPVLLNGYRFMLAGIPLTVYLVFRGKRLTEHILQGGLLGLITFLLFLPQTIGLQYTTASNSGFITGLFVAFVPIFMPVIFDLRPTLMEILAAVVSVVGLWVLTGGLTDFNVGDLLTLMTAVCCALHVLYVDRCMKGGADPLLLGAQQFVVAGLLCLVVAAVFNLPYSIASGRAVLIVVFLALFPTLSAMVIQLAAQKILSPMRVSLIFALEPVFAALFAWTLGGERIVVHRAIGGLFIFLALIISGIRTGHPTEPKAE